MWYHQYDSIPKNHSSKRIRVVIDLYTSQDYFFYDLKGIKFTDLIVKARNLNKELAFISFNGDIKISLGELKNLPKVYDVPVVCENCSDCEDCEEEHLLFSDIDYYHHVKLDISYTLYSPKFNKYSWGSGYDSFTHMENSFEEEFHLNIPNGLRIDENSLMIYLFGKKSENDELDTIVFRGVNNQINCNKDALNNRYTLKVDDERYLEFIKNHKYEKSISLEYRTKNEVFYYLINIFAFIVLILNIVGFIVYNNSNLPGTGLIVLISFSALYLALKREGYIFAFDKLILGFLLLSGLLFTLVCLSINANILLFVN